MTNILADIVWPSLVLEQRLLSVWIIISGLVVEFFFIRRITGLSIRRCILADLAMNAASALLGVLLIPISGVLWEFIAEFSINRLTGMHTFNPVTWIVTFIMAVLINAVLETLVLRVIFRQKMGKRGFGWMCIANTLSVGIAAGSLLLFPIRG